MAGAGSSRAEPPEHAEELTSLAIADLAAVPRIDEEPTEKRPGRLAAMCDGYSLECRPNVAPHDRPGLARLLRYTADWGDAVDAMPDWDSHSAD